MKIEIDMCGSRGCAGIMNAPLDNTEDEQKGYALFDELKKEILRIGEKHGIDFFYSVRNR